MKTTELLTVAVFLSLQFVILPGAALADIGPIPVVPEPSAILIWVGIAGAGSAVYWWRNRRQS